MTTIAGEWTQDSNYFQSKNLIDQLGEIDAFENGELYIADGHLVAMRLVGKEPNEQVVYWESPLSLTTDTTGGHWLKFQSYDGQPITAGVSFEHKHLILRIGNRSMGFLRDHATNLRRKGYIPKS